MDRYRVKPGEPITLADRDPSDRSEFDGDKKAGRAHARQLNERLEALQELLYAEGKHKVLVVLQALDAGGKDGTIRHVFDGTNPQGVRVASFKKPSTRERNQDYLWRVHQHTPPNGHLTIFNRSHYEDVLVVRVREFVPEAQWRRRYEHIRAFEKMLADEGTKIVKFFLHISKEEQRERLQARLDEPDKHWKFTTSDLEERKLWEKYQIAYEEALSETSTDYAPWYVIPANRKWYRNIVISDILVNALEGLEMDYPEAEEGLSEIVVT